MEIEQDHDSTLSPRDVIKKHDRFYFPDGNLTLLVANTLFKVHRFYFQRDSDIFREMFTLEVPEAEEAEGTSDEHPIKLDGQNIEDLESFLSVLYPETFDERHSPSLWFSCFQFAYKWKFDPQKEFALRKHCKHGSRAAYSILAARMCGKGVKFLTPLFIQLINSPPTPEEGRVLGTDDLVLLCKLYNIRRGERFSRLSDQQEARFVTAVLEGVDPSIIRLGRP